MRQAQFTVNMDPENISINVQVNKDNWQEKIKELEKFIKTIRKKYDKMVYYMAVARGKYADIAYFILNEKSDSYCKILANFASGFDDYNFTNGTVALSKLMDMYKKEEFRHKLDISWYRGQDIMEVDIDKLPKPRALRQYGCEFEGFFDDEFEKLYEQAESINAEYDPEMDNKSSSSSSSDNDSDDSSMQSN